MNLNFLKQIQPAYLMPGINNFIKRIRSCKYILGLFFLNFFTHFLFISRYGFTSDDWDLLVNYIYSNYPLTNLLLESQRPLQFILFKVASGTFGSYAFAYQILNLLTTSLMILLVFLVAKSLFKDVFQDPAFYAFLAATLFCVFFNIDELYAWSSIFPINLAIVLYLSSFYFYINANQKQYYLFLSVFSFLIAVFIYELGIFLPLLCFFYDLVFNRNWKKSLVFILPLSVYGIIRVTFWFGFGWVSQNRNPVFSSPQFFQGLISTFVHNFVREFALTGLNIFYGISGLLSLNYAILIVLIVLDGLCIGLIFKYLIMPGLSGEHPSYNFQNAVKLSCIGIAGFILSTMIISVGGYAATRHLVFIDFFIFLIIVAIAGPVLTKKSAVIPMFCIILICVLINQGLFVNWIIAGDICSSANQSIYENSKNISPYNYVFINATDLFISKPNAALKSTLISDQYNPYLNSRCLSDGAVIAMLSGAGVNTSVIHLIYGNTIYGNPTIVVLGSVNGSLMYEDMTTRTYYSINRTEYFEFNSTNLLATYHEKERSDFLFQH